MANKYSLLLLLLLIFYTNIVAQQWTEQVSGVTVQLTSVSTFDHVSAWVCGYSGTVLKTTNTGNNWINVSGNGIPATVQLINIFEINPNTALVAGYIGSDTWVYRTSNGGANWTQVFAQPGGFINAVHIRLDSTGFMAGDPVGGRWSLWRTTNNGITWDSSGLYLPQTGTETGYNNSLCVSMNRIWFGTNNSRIYYSSNNGTNWIVQPSAPETNIYAVWFDPNGVPEGYSGGVNILKTTNYGTNWSSIGSLGTGNIAGISGLPMFTGILWYVKSGNPNIYWGNGFGSWTLTHTAPAGTYRHISMMRVSGFPLGGYAVRNNGGISHSTFIVQDIKNVSSKIPETSSLSQNYPNPFNPSTILKFQIANTISENVKLVVYDILGNEVKTLVDEKLNGGIYEAEFDGNGFASGIYFYKLILGGDLIDTKKMILVK